MRKLKMIEISEILYRWIKGLKIKQIARSLGYSKNSVKSIVRQAEILGLEGRCEQAQLEAVVCKIKDARYENNSSCKHKASLGLAAYDERIISWLKEPSITITQISRLIGESGLKTSETTLRRYIKARFPETQCRNYTIPMASSVGEEAQVDYGYVGLMKDATTGKLRKTYAFVMTLSYSRYRYVEFSFKQDTRSWIRCHINAFKFFGGVPRAILLDNLKAGVVVADIYDPTINKTYSELERFYGFVADPAKVRKPEHKGKVERSVLIVKQQLIAGRSYTHVSEANEYAQHWCRNIIAKKITRTTGKTPEELFIEEKPSLIDLPGSDFDISEWVIAKVHKDHHVVCQGNFYSVPTKYIGLEVPVKISFNTVEIYYENKLVKAHIKHSGKGKWVTDTNDYPDSVLRYLKMSPEKCQIEADKIGEATGEIIKLVLSSKSKQRLRKAQAILRLKEEYGGERLELACLRAFIFNIDNYEQIKNILANNLETKIVEEEAVIKYDVDYEGAYLRPASSYKSSMEAHYG